jgi:hypothetical protein
MLFTRGLHTQAFSHHSCGHKVSVELEVVPNCKFPLSLMSVLPFFFRVEMVAYMCSLIGCILLACRDRLTVDQFIIISQSLRLASLSAKCKHIKVLLKHR